MPLRDVADHPPVVDQGHYSGHDLMLARCVVGAGQSPVRGLQQPNRELGVAEVYAGHQIAGTADDPEAGLVPGEHLAGGIPARETQGVAGSCLSLH